VKAKPGKESARTTQGAEPREGAIGDPVAEC